MGRRSCPGRVARALLAVAAYTGVVTLVFLSRSANVKSGGVKAGAEVGVDTLDPLRRIATGRHLRGSRQVVSRQGNVVGGQPVPMRPAVPARSPQDSFPGILRAVPAAHLAPRGMSRGGRGGAGGGAKAISWCKTPLRMLPRPGPVVALASFPGSGNTWLRYLLQQATGLITGSVYKDFALMKNGFPGESVRNGSVVAVKTHEFQPESIRLFDKAILLVRDPFASIQAEFNRRSGGHVGHATVEKYRRDGGTKWRSFALAKAEEWEKMHRAWHDAFTNGSSSSSVDGNSTTPLGSPSKASNSNLLVVRYDRLTEDVAGELRRVLRFVGREADAASEERMRCVVSRRQGAYKRPKKPLGFDPYDAAMRRVIWARMADVYALLGLDAPPPLELSTTARSPTATVAD